MIKCGHFLSFPTPPSLSPPLLPQTSTAAKPTKTLDKTNPDHMKPPQLKMKVNKKKKKI